MTDDEAKDLLQRIAGEYAVLIKYFRDKSARLFGEDGGSIDRAFLYALVVSSLENGDPQQALSNLEPISDEIRNNVDAALKRVGFKE